MAEQRFMLDGWHVDVAACRMSRDGETRNLEPKVMKTLACLAGKPGEVITKDALLEQVWDHTFVTDAALTRCIFEIRSAFNDDASNPRIIETITKVGYRLIATPESERIATRSTPSRARWLAAAAVTVLALSTWWTQGADVDATPTTQYEIFSEVPAANDAYHRGLSHYARANYLANANAITFFQKAVEYDPSFSLAYTRLADALTQLSLRWGHDRLDEARDAAKAAIELDPTNADSFSALGLAHLLSDDTDAALDALQHAYEIDPTHWKSMYNAAITHHARFEHQESIALFQRVVELVPEHFEATSRLGFVYLRTGDTDAARHWLESTLVYAPESVRAWSELAMLALVTRDTGKAIDNCSRILDRLPLHEPCIHVTAISYQLQGDMDEARKYFETSIANHARTDYSRLGIAQILISEGREEEGIEAINAVLEQALARVSGEHDPLRDYRIIAACFSLLGDNSSAMAWLEKSHETGRRFPLWDAIDPVLADLHGDARFNRFISTARNFSSH